MNEIKAILLEKDNEMKDLQSQVTLLQNHVSTVWWPRGAIVKFENKN